MKYDILFRQGGQITIESRRTLDELSDFFTDTAPRIWGVLADDGDPVALVSIADVVAIVPSRTAEAPARVIDKDGDTWIEIEPDSDRWNMLDRVTPYTLAESSRNYGPLKS
jgi:hypothetical protein